MKITKLEESRITILALLVITICFSTNHSLYSFSAANIYISQAGGGAGTSCASPLAPAFFNNPANWGGGAAQIGPGTTVHLCGTFTGIAASDPIMQFQGSGTVGNPVTVLFEPGAILTAPYWGLTGAISGGSLSWIVIDGGMNGTIQNTAAGSNLMYICTGGGSPLVCNTKGIYLTDATNIEVKNLNILNLYVHVCSAPPPFVPCTDTGLPNDTGSAGVYVNGGSNVNIHNNTIHDVFQGVDFIYPGGVTSDNINIHHNTITNVNWGIQTGSGAPNALLTHWQANFNTISGWDNWNDSISGNHHDGIILFTQAAGDLITNPVMNGNVFGTPLSLMTAQVFIDTQNAGNDNIVGAMVSNNIFYNPPTNTTGCPANGYIANSGSGIVANNSIVASITGPCSGSSNAGNNGIALGSPTGTGWVYINNLLTNVWFGFLAAGTGGISNSDYNLMYNSLWGWQMPNPENDTLASWQAAYPGHDTHSLEANPNLNGSFVPNSGSPAIAAGLNLTATYCGTYPLLCSDANGNARPSGVTAWDIGATNAGTAITLVPSRVDALARNGRVTFKLSNGAIPSSWSISPQVGTITQAGVYTAPPAIPTAQTVTVTAISAGVQYQAIINLAPDVVTITVSPTTATVGPSGQQLFTATVGGTINTAVTWSTNPTGAWTISAGGLFTAPPTIPVQQTVNVIATSQADMTKAASATVTLKPNTPPKNCTITFTSPSKGTQTFTILTSLCQ